jgi:hypothetical protein
MFSNEKLVNFRDNFFEMDSYKSVITHVFMADWNIKSISLDFTSVGIFLHLIFTDIKKIRIKSS